MDKKNIKRRVVKKKRVLPYRKWSDYETTLLVDYIKENELEKPSGRIFYQNFVQTFNMNINWSLVKNKLRNLKTLYEKAVAWERSDAAKNIPEGESVQSIMNRICPFYDSLKQVFGEKLTKSRAVNPYSSKLEIEYSQDAVVIKSSYSPPSSPQHVAEEQQVQRCSAPIHENITMSDNIDNESTGSVVIYQQKSCQTETITPAVAVENTYPIKTESGRQEHNACNCLTEVVKVMTSYQKEASEHKKAHLELEYKKFDFEKEKTFRDLELRQREIEKNERLQVLEIESKERIALKELEYKYKQRF